MGDFEVTDFKVRDFNLKSLTLMIDGDKKVVSKQPFASFPKVNSLQSLEYYAKIALILSLGMNYSIVINKCF